MSSLATVFAGMPIKNPIVVAAGPWSRNGAAIQKAIDAGAAAVVTETIVLEEAANQPSPHLFLGTNPDQMFNLTRFSNLSLEQWEQELECVQKKDCLLIASIYGRSASEIAYLAGKVERMGVDAIEVTLSAPVGIRNRTSNSNPAEIHDCVRAAVEATEIPVFVKLSYESSMSRTVIEALEQAGARGVTAINSMKGLKGVDLENHRVHMSSYAGYSGMSIKPMALATVATLKQLSHLPVCACGGIYTVEDVLEFLMLGAGAVELASVVLREGYGIITKILQDLEYWLDTHLYHSVKDTVGLALDSIFPFEEVSPRQLRVRLVGTCDGCGICVRSCLYDTLSCDAGTVSILSGACTGCGMCTELCPHKALQLWW